MPLELVAAFERHGFVWGGKWWHYDTMHFEYRPELLAYARNGDSIHVYAVDRLGRDALDVQATVRHLLNKGITVQIHGLGEIVGGVGELILAVLAQVADMERKRITERTAAGRETAREALVRTGKTHKGKASMGRPVKMDALQVAAWREENKASITETAAHFGISAMTVTRYCREAKDQKAEA